MNSACEISTASHSSSGKIILERGICLFGEDQYLDPLLNYDFDIHYGEIPNEWQILERKFITKDVTISIAREDMSTLTIISPEIEFQRIDDTATLDKEKLPDLYFSSQPYFKETYTKSGLPIIFLDNIDYSICKLTNKSVLIPRKDEIENYLRNFSKLTDIVLDTCDLVLGEFKNNAQLSLEVYHDPEIEDEHLVLYIRQEHYDNDIDEKIEDICSKYENRLIDTDGWFLVTTDFGPPI